MNAKDAQKAVTDTERRIEQLQAERLVLAEKHQTAQVRRDEKTAAIASLQAAAIRQGTPDAVRKAEGAEADLFKIEAEYRRYAHALAEVDRDIQAAGWEAEGARDALKRARLAEIQAEVESIGLPALNDLKGWQRLQALWEEGRALLIALAVPGEQAPAGPFRAPAEVFGHYAALLLEAMRWQQGIGLILEGFEPLRTASIRELYFGK